VPGRQLVGPVGHDLGSAGARGRCRPGRQSATPRSPMCRSPRAPPGGEPPHQRPADRAPRATPDPDHYNQQNRQGRLGGRPGRV